MHIKFGEVKFVYGLLTYLIVSPRVSDSIALVRVKLGYVSFAQCTIIGLCWLTFS